LEELLAELEPELQQKLTIIHCEFPFEKLAKPNFSHNRKIIHKVLNPTKALHAYFHEASDNEIVLELGNIQSMPIEVLDLSYKGKPVLKLQNKIILPAKHSSRPTNYQLVRFAIPANMAWSNEMIKDLKVNYKIFGTERQRQETVFTWSHLSANFLKTDFIRQPPNAHKFDFLKFNENSKKIYFRAGNWTLGQNLVVPKNRLLICGEGTSLNLVNNATILSYSPIQFIGSEEKPIKIFSTDSTGQGLLVLNAKEPSFLEYVIFENLTNPSKRGWKLTGAVNFYESPVKIYNCQFKSNRSEDGLNIIRSDFILDNSIFQNTSSDAFDGDFVKGEINNSSFINCGNDGIDVSGSIVQMTNIFMDGIGDKGISVGENSQASLDRIEIKNAEIGVASKDMSEMTINNIAISESKIGFSSYQKKPEFAGAIIRVNESDLRKLEIPFLIEENSRLTIDGKEIASSRKNVTEILYGVEFGKSSN
jgi:hypothetical protein